MLTIRDNTGLDLGQQVPAPVNLAATSLEGTPVTLIVYGVESDASLSPISLNGTISWNDGNPNSVFPYTSTSNGTLTMAAQRVLSPGYHNIGLYVENYRAPVPDQVQVNVSITVLNPASNRLPMRALYGPILPKDMGFPNVNQWNFNLDADLAVLASSVKMLLETRIGERVMLPNYGTDIRALIFELEVSGIETLVQEKLTQALSVWEPRVGVSLVTVNRNADRSITVYASLVSRLTQQQFDVMSTFSQ